MTLHDDLLKQAGHLARREPKRPTQASLRRAISACYYAVFHLLIDDATRLMFPGRGRASLRSVAARAFHHAAMKAVAKQFSRTDSSGRPLPPAKLAPALDGQPLPPALVDVAATFQDLQQARHEADYDLSRRFTRAEVLLLVDQTTQAFADWHSVRGSLPADTFLAGLLTYNNIQG